MSWWHTWWSLPKAIDFWNDRFDHETPQSGVFSKIGREMFNNCKARRTMKHCLTTNSRTFRFFSVFVSFSGNKLEMHSTMAALWPDDESMCTCLRSSDARGCAARKIYRSLGFCLQSANCQKSRHSAKKKRRSDGGVCSLDVANLIFGIFKTANEFILIKLTHKAHKP